MARAPVALLLLFTLLGAEVVRTADAARRAADIGSKGGQHVLNSDDRIEVRDKPSALGRSDGALRGGADKVGAVPHGADGHPRAGAGTGAAAATRTVRASQSTPDANPAVATVVEPPTPSDPDADPVARFVAGGTTLLDYIKAHVPTADMSAEQVLSVPRMARDEPVALQRLLRRDYPPDLSLGTEQRESLRSLLEGAAGAVDVLLSAEVEGLMRQALETAGFPAGANELPAARARAKSVIAAGKALLELERVEAWQRNDLLHAAQALADLVIPMYPDAAQAPTEDLGLDLGVPAEQQGGVTLLELEASTRVAIFGLNPPRSVLAVSGLVGVGALFVGAVGYGIYHLCRAAPPPPPPGPPPGPPPPPPPPCAGEWGTAAPPAVAAAGGTLSAVLPAPGANFPSQAPPAGRIIAGAPGPGGPFHCVYHHHCVMTGEFMPHEGALGLPHSVAELQSIVTMLTDMSVGTGGALVPALGVALTGAAAVTAAVDAAVAAVGGPPGDCEDAAQPALLELTAWNQYLAESLRPLMPPPANTVTYVADLNRFMTPLRRLLGEAALTRNNKQVVITHATPVAAAGVTCANRVWTGPHGATNWARSLETFLLHELAAFQTLLAIRTAQVAGGAPAAGAVPIMDIGYDSLAGNPRWAAKRLSAAVVARPIPSWRDRAQLFYRLVAQTNRAGELWAPAHFEGGATSAPPYWVTGAAARSRGHLIAASYASSSLTAAMGTCTTANAANQEGGSNSVVWAALEGRVRAFAAALPPGQSVAVVVGVDGVHAPLPPAVVPAAPPTLDVGWLPLGMPLVAQPSVNPAYFWTALHVAVAPGPGVACQTTAFACVSHPGRGGVAAAAANVPIECDALTITQLIANTGVDPFPGLGAADANCAPPVIGVPPAAWAFVY